MAFTPAKTIDSSRQACHSKLEKTVFKHLQNPYQKPIAAHTQLAFEQAYDYWKTTHFEQVILDSACGTAESSRSLAKKFPHALIIGLDRSIKRLSNSENENLPKNCVLLRCDCTDFWRLAEARQWKFHRHYLLYPNPYPKTDDLKKRWHGHPTFTSLITISQSIELRTNWKIYAEEFLQSLKIAGKKSVVLQQYETQKPMTAFERKYHRSQHDLWQVLSD